MEFVSNNCLVCTSTGSWVSLSMWNLISVEAKCNALKSRDHQLKQTYLFHYKCNVNCFTVRAYPLSILLFLRIFASEFSLRSPRVRLSFILGSSILIWASAYVKADLNYWKIKLGWNKVEIRTSHLFCHSDKNNWTTLLKFNRWQLTFDLIILLWYLDDNISAFGVISQTTLKANLRLDMC